MFREKCNANSSTDKKEGGLRMDKGFETFFMDGAAHLFSHGMLPGKQLSRFCGETLCHTKMAISPVDSLQPLGSLEVQRMMQHTKHHLKVRAVRRRRAHLKSETYVLLEPGKAEEFVSEEELRIRLKARLENWPNDELPPDLARFNSIDDAVSHLVKCVCELEIDGEVGSVQWYQVQLE